MSFSFREPLFLYPGHKKTLFAGIEVLFIAALVMALDHARGFAFVIWPTVVLLRYLTAAGMNWSWSTKAAVLKYSIVSSYFLLGEFLLILVLAEEAGQPMF